MSNKLERALIAKGLGTCSIYTTVILATNGGTIQFEIENTSAWAEEVFGYDLFSGLEPGLYVLEGTPEWVERGVPWDGGTHMDLEWKDVKIRQATMAELPALLQMETPEPKGDCHEDEV